MGRSTKAVRHRRVFTAEFKLGAVRRMQERCGHGVSLPRRIAREGVAMSDKYAVIDAHRPTYAVQLMCDTLDVAPSGYDAAQQRPPSARAVADDALRVHVRAQFRASGETYGAPRPRANPQASGQRVAKKRIAPLLGFAQCGPESVVNDPACNPLVNR